MNCRVLALVAGRAFLPGGAHLMPRFASQGLGSGIRDAASLAWKLADVLTGRLRESALDSDHPERRPHTQTTAELSARLGRIVMSADRLTACVDHKERSLARFRPR